MRPWIFAGLVALAACGARTEITGTGAFDASNQGAPDVANPDVRDADAPDAAADATGKEMDASSCLALPTAACTCGDGPCSTPFNTVLRDAVAQCSSAGPFVCGEVTATFDANGCALSYDYIAADAPDSFRSCLESTVSSQRWPCEMGESVTAYLGSCTLH